MALWGVGREKKKNFFLTEPAHKPSLESEKYRIYSNRGEIRETSDGVQKLFLRARMYPGLKVTRTLGDMVPH